MTNPSPTENPFLSAALRDLEALTSLLAAWAGKEASEVAAMVADTIREALQADLVYVRLHVAQPGQAREALLLSGRAGTQAQCQQLWSQLAERMTGGKAMEPVALHGPAAAGGARAQLLRLGKDGREGALVVGSEQPDFPGELDRLRLQVIANQTAHWSQYAQLLAREHDVLRTLDGLSRLGQLFAADLSLDALIQAVTDAATQLAGAELGAFFFEGVRERGEGPELLALSGAPRDAIAEFSMRRNTPAVGPTLPGASIVRSGNVGKDSRFKQAPPFFGMLPGHLSMTSYLAVPVVARSGRVLGELCFGHAQPDHFNAGHERLMAGLAAQTAIAIDNAQLYQAELRAREQLETKVQTRTAELLQSESRFQLLINSVEDHAIFMLDPHGVVVSWNTGAARIKGYRAEEIMGQRFSRFYTAEDQRAGKPERGLALARETGHFEAEGWRVRKDGSQFWANVVITPVYDSRNNHVGFAKVTRDLTKRRQMEEDLRESREQLRQLSAYAEKAREEERARIAREIHDELGGTLTGLKMDLAQLKRFIDPAGAKRLDDYAAAINDTIQTVRRIATELRPAVLDDFGLLAAMEWQLREFERRAGIRAYWRSSVERLALPSDTATAIFRVFQESLTNIARHAQASEVHVLCNIEQNQLQLRVQDNGIGLLPEQANGAGSLGLVGMRERMRLAGGAVSMHGQPGVGTTIEVTVALEAGSVSSTQDDKGSS